MVPQPVVDYACNPLCVLYDFDMPLPCSEFRFGYKMVMRHIFSVAYQLSLGLKLRCGETTVL